MSEAIPQNADENRIDGLNSIGGVAFVVGKDAEDLRDIEPFGEGRAFHKARSGNGYYFVDIKEESCTCPSFKFGTGLVNGKCKHFSRVTGRLETEKRNAESRPKADFSAAW